MATEGYQSSGSSNVTVWDAGSSSGGGGGNGGGGGTGGDNTIVVRARGTSGGEHINLRIDNSTVADWTLSTSMQDYTWSGSNTGGIVVQFDNDGANRDVQVDYIQVNGSTRQAEDQSYNTGAWDGECGGGSNTEWLHCNGSIGFGDVSGGGNLMAAPSTPTPEAFELSAAYPNPFNPTTTIRYGAPEAADVSLVIYDVIGREVARLVDGSVDAGFHEVRFNASGHASGIYIYRLEAEGESGHHFRQSGRMALLK